LNRKTLFEAQFLQDIPFGMNKRTNFKIKLILQKLLKIFSVEDSAEGELLVSLRFWVMVDLPALFY